MTEDSLTAGRQYVKRHRSRGKPDEAIRAALAAAGWGPELLETLWSGLPPRQEAPPPEEAKPPAVDERWDEASKEYKEALLAGDQQKADDAVRKQAAVALEQDDMKKLFLANANILSRQQRGRLR